MRHAAKSCRPFQTSSSLSDLFLDLTPGGGGDGGESEKEGKKSGASRSLRSFPVTQPGARKLLLLGSRSSKVSVLGMEPWSGGTQSSQLFPLVPMFVHALVWGYVSKVRAPLLLALNCGISRFFGGFLLRIDFVSSSLREIKFDFKTLDGRRGGEQTERRWVWRHNQTQYSTFLNHRDTVGF